MKVIISGVTGFIGGEVLQQCIENPAISHVCTLSRRPLPEPFSTHPKVTSIIMKDFNHYSEETLQQLSGAEACFWALGIVRPTPDPRAIDIGFSQAAAKAFEARLQPQLGPGKKFHFVHVSGFLAEPDQDRPLWFINDMRKSKGGSEVAIHDFARSHPETFETYVVRAAFVMSKGNFLAPFWEWLVGSTFINVKHLALAMIDIAEQGGPSKTYSNHSLVERGRKIVALQHS